MTDKTSLTTKEWIRFNIFRPLLIGMGKSIAPFSTVGNPPIFSNELFPYTKLLEEKWPLIRKELEQVMQHHQTLPNIQEIQHEQSVLSTDSKWKTFFFYGFGTKAEQNCALCPETAKVLEQVPNLLTAFFSIMYPKKHIPAHEGLFKGIVRTHLGMIIPNNNAGNESRMQVGNETIYWKEGKAVVFDDTYRHEVWNDSDEIRVVLLIDTIRPFKKPFSSINKFIIDLIIGSAHVKDAVNNHREWEGKFNKIFS